MFIADHQCFGLLFSNKKIFHFLRFIFDDFPEVVGLEVVVDPGVGPAHVPRAVGNLISVSFRSVKSVSNSAINSVSNIVRSVSVSVSVSRVSVSVSVSKVMTFSVLVSDSVSVSANEIFSGKVKVKIKVKVVKIMSACVNVAKNNLVVCIAKLNP